MTGSAMTLRNIVIAVLRKSNFKRWNAVLDADPTAPSGATAWTAKATLDAAMEPGWRHLVLADADTWLSTDGSGAGVRSRLLRAGGRIGDEARAGTKGDELWTPIGPAMAAVLLPKGASDPFSWEWASANAGDTVKVKENAIFVLPLKPAA